MSVVAALPGPAAAATAIGQTDANLSDFCSGRTFIQDTIGAGPSYTVPAGGGVITSYSIFAIQHTATSQFFFKVLARTSTPLVSPETFRVVGSDGPRSLVANQLNTFETSIPVTGGEVLGEWFPYADAVPCAFRTPNTFDEIIFTPGTNTPNPAQGTTVTITSSPLEVTFQDHTRLNLSAVVEPLTAPKLASPRIKAVGGFAKVPLWGQVASRGSLTLIRSQRGHRVVLGRSRFTLRARRTKMVRVRLSHSAVRLLARAGRVDAVAAVRAKDALGRVRVRTVAVTIARA